MPFIRLSLARVAASRKSGCECSSAFSNSGNSDGMNGIKSRVSSTNAQIFPHVTAAFCLSSFVRSRKPRRMTGKMTANEGASIELTNVVSMSLSKQSSVFDCGSLMALMMRFNIPKISAFFTQAQMLGKISADKAETLGCVSKRHSKNAGNKSGTVRIKDCGTRFARSPMMCKDPSLHCQSLCCIPAKIAGDKSFMAVKGKALTTDACAKWADSRTSASLSPIKANTSGARPTA
mmetsp:Transcript_5305/g.19328  ORF Transcript_5305/g.19328 Transcript_5305/m.19328 type:complete len:234 (-) Transcript_5305:995-1696(-)